MAWEIFYLLKYNFLLKYNALDYFAAAEKGFTSYRTKILIHKIFKYFIELNRIFITLKSVAIILLIIKRFTYYITIYILYSSYLIIYWKSTILFIAFMFMLNSNENKILTEKQHFVNKKLVNLG